MLTWMLVAVLLSQGCGTSPATGGGTSCTARYEGRVHQARRVVVVRFVLQQIAPSYEVLWSEARAIPAGNDGSFGVVLGADKEQPVVPLLTSGNDRYLSIERDEEGLSQTVPVGSSLSVREGKVTLGDPARGQMTIQCPALSTAEDGSAL